MKVVTADGATIDLGTTETTPTISITDYSRRVTDDFGVTTVVERGFARRLSVRLAVPFDGVDALQRRLADLRATAATWVADDRFAWLSAKGFYRDFELDLAVPPISFCTLTVEGFAETEVGADTGGDPAPVGLQSTLQLLQPITVTDAALLTSSVAENDAPAWAAASTYAMGARVMRDHQVYESLIAGNVGAEPAKSPAAWLTVGPTNRWAMFDDALGTATEGDRRIEVTVSAGRFNAIALLDVAGATVRVRTTGYDRMQAVSAGATTFLDIPAGDAQVTVTIVGPGAVSVGTLLIGTVVRLGATEAAPTASITDYSRKEVDDFGEVTIVRRAWAKRMTARALIDTSAIDAVANRIAAVRARPSLWIGQEGIDSLSIYGFFKDFSIEVGETVSKLALSIEGMSQASKIEPITGKVDWPDVGDPNGTKPKDNADETGKNTSKDTAAVGGRPSGELINVVDLTKKAVETAQADVVYARSEIVQARTDLAAADDAVRKEVAAARGDVTQARADITQARSDLATEVQRAKDDTASIRTVQDTIQRDVSGNSTRISDETTARANADSALANRATALEARGGGAGGNLIAQTQFLDLTGWINGYHLITPGLIGLNGAGAEYQPGGENNLTVRELGRAPEGGYFDWVCDPFSVRAGEYYQFYAWVASHRAAAEVYVIWRDAANAIITYSASSSRIAGPGGRDLNNWGQMGVPSVQAPPGAVTASLAVRKHTTAAGFDDSWMWFFRPYFGQARQGQTEWNGFTHGSGTPFAAGTLARLVTEETTRANADSAVAARASTLEAQFRGDTDSAVFTRLRNEETARASADSALAGRANTLEAQFRGDTESPILARIRAEETARADAVSAVANRATSLEAKAASATDQLAKSFPGFETRFDTWGFDTQKGGRNAGDFAWEGYHTKGAGIAFRPGMGDYLYMDPRGFIKTTPGKRYRAGFWVWQYSAPNGYGGATRLYWEGNNRDGSVGVYLGASANAPEATQPFYSHIPNGAWHCYATDLFVDDAMTAAETSYWIRPRINIDAPPAGAGYVIAGWFFREVTGEFENAAKITDEATVRANADSALAGRASTMEAQFRGEQPSALKTSIENKRQNLIDLSWWKKGAAIPWAFNNGQRNEIVEFPHGGNFGGIGMPDGSSGDAWLCQADAGEAGGGWGGGTIARLDPDKTYRFILPIAALHATGQRTSYWGASGVATLNSTAEDPNPYFAVLGNLPTDRWHLFVGYIYPRNSAGKTHDGAGVWDMRTGTKVGAGNNFCFLPDGRQPTHRAYQYYATNGAYQAFGRPVVECVDGSEQPILAALNAAAKATQADARITDEAATRAGADSALAGRASTLEAQFRGDTDSAVFTRLRNEETARASADSALAGRANTLEAQFRGDTDSPVLARLRSEETVRANADSALASRSTALEARGGVGGGNMAPNTQFVPRSDNTDIPGWSFGATNTRFGYAQINWPAQYYMPDENVLASLHSGAADGGYAEWASSPIPVRPGDYVQYYAYINCHRTAGSVFLYFYNTAGETVGNAPLATVSNTGNLGNELRYYTQQGVKSFRIPEGVAQVRLMLRHEDNMPGQSDGYCWFTRPYLGFAREGQTEWNSFVHGSLRPSLYAVGARITDEATTRANADSALATRASTLEAQLRGDTDSPILARIRNEETARADANSALATRASNVEARAGGLEARTAIVETSAVDSANKLAAARVSLTAVSPGGVATFELFSSNAGGAGYRFGGNGTFVGQLDIASAESGGRMVLRNDVLRVFDDSGGEAITLGRLS